MEDFDIPQNKMAESAERVVDRAQEEARRREPALGIVAVDIPIGLPDDRPRATDVQARRRLPVGRKSSVFPGRCNNGK